MRIHKIVIIPGAEIVKIKCGFGLAVRSCKWYFLKSLFF